MPSSRTSLWFDRTGRRLIVIEPEEVVVLDGAASVRLAYPGARSVAGFEHELWIAIGDDRLVRVDPSGTMIGAPIALPFAVGGRLHAAPCGPPAAVWSASVPVMCSLAGVPAVTVGARSLSPSVAPGVAANAAVRCVEIPGVDAVIPITGWRVVTARGARVSLPSGVSVALAPGSRVLGGCVGADGKSLTLLVARGRDRELVAIALGLGQLTHRRVIPHGAVVAIAAGVAVIQLEPRVLRVIDLTMNVELGGVKFGEDVAGFDVDPSGRSLAIRCASGGVELHRIDPLFQRSFARPRRRVTGTPPTGHAEPAILAQFDHTPAGSAEPSPTLPVVARATERGEPMTPREQAEPWLPTGELGPPVSASTVQTSSSVPLAHALDEVALPEVPIYNFGTPTAHATDWLWGTGDHTNGGI